MGFTPFFLIYGADAVLLEEVSYTSPRVLAYDDVMVEEALQDSLDRLDEHRGGACTINKVLAAAT